jgi:transposase
VRGGGGKLVDLGSVREQLRALLAEGRHDELLDIVFAMLETLQRKNSELELDRLRLLRKHLGQTSEKTSSAQLELLLSLLPEGESRPEVATTLAPPATEPLESDEPAPRTKRKGHGRKPLPADLPRTDVVHAVPAEERVCEVCSAEKKCIGHEVSEVLNFKPAGFVIEQHKREKLACENCPEDGITVAAAPDKVIEKGRPGPELLAQIVVSKYEDKNPLSRQKTIFERCGVSIPVSTMVGWVAAVAECLAPLAEEIRRRALGAHVLAVDDTGLKVLDDSAPGGSKRGHLWFYIGDAAWCAVRYTPDWTKEGPGAVLVDRVGWLQADAYAGFDHVYAKGLAIEVGCWAHARRPFVELARGGDPRAAIFLTYVQKLYAIERSATDDGVAHEERRRRRQEQAKPVLEAIGKWCAATYNTEPPKNALPKAIAYVVNQWVALNRYLEDGRLPIDNTMVERALRGVATGRKNFLFAGSDAGAERAATIYTVLATCKLNGVSPFAYVADVLRRLEMERFPSSRIHELLPPIWRENAPASARTATSR